MWWCVTDIFSDMFGTVGFKYKDGRLTQMFHCIGFKQVQFYICLWRLPLHITQKRISGVLAPIIKTCFGQCCDMKSWSPNQRSKNQGCLVEMDIRIRGLGLVLPRCWPSPPRRPPPSPGTVGQPSSQGGQTHRGRVGQAAWTHRRNLKHFLDIKPSKIILRR